MISKAGTLIFYGYDAMGNVWQMTNAGGAATDTYDYEALGNEVHATGSTPNNYLCRGEQYDADQTSITFAPDTTTR